MSTIRQVLVDVERRFTQAGIESARTDAELLLAHTLGVSRSQLMIAPELSEDQKHNYELLIRRRVLREPLQYITKTAPFRRLELIVGPGVLVPRPESELIIDIVKRFGRSGIALDLGSGSGCLALSLATEFPQMKVFAVENSQTALNYLHENISKHESEFLPDSTVTALGLEISELPTVHRELIGKAELVVANPPYVPTGSVVAHEVQYFEPAEAVFASNNGYAVIDQVIATAIELLKPGGLIVIEHDQTHGLNGTDGGVASRLKKTGLFNSISAVDDLTGRPRFTYATLESS